MENRRCNDWISSYLKFVEHTESPISFHIWSAISAISASLERRCQMYWGHTVIWPNQYIILIGSSAQSRKGEALSRIADITDSTELNLVSSSITREAMIQTFVTNQQIITNPATGDVSNQCALYCVSQELAVLLGQKNIKFLADLTDWYDSKDRWSYRTMSRQDEIIEGVCLNLLGASAPDWLSSIFPVEVVGGGFTSRCILIVEKNKGKIVADPNLYPVDRDLQEDLIYDLQRIQQLTGEFRFSQEAHDTYVAWYTQQEENMKRGISPIQDPRFGSYMGRRATHIKKVGMAISASRGDDMIINSNDFDRACTILEAAEKKMSSAFNVLGEAKFVKSSTDILNFIQSRGRVSRSVVMRLFYRDVDAWSLEQIEVILQRMKVLKIYSDPAGNEVYYEYVKPEPDEG